MEPLLWYGIVFQILDLLTSSISEATIKYVVDMQIQAIASESVFS